MNVIITGSTGMVGKGILLECLEHPEVEKILIINRTTLGLNHPKVTELILPNFNDIVNHKDVLTGYDACFYSMGISSLGKSEETYSAITYDITKQFADTLYDINHKLVFNYVSGSGTDSSESGKVMWGRVKGKTENYILNKGFRDAYMFRPGAIIPEKGIKSSTGWINFILVLFSPIYFLMRKSKHVTTTTTIGQAMIQLVKYPLELKHLENKDINKILGKK